MGVTHTPYTATGHSLLFLLLGSTLYSLLAR